MIHLAMWIDPRPRFNMPLQYAVSICRFDMSLRYSVLDLVRYANHGLNCMDIPVAVSKMSDH
jgi:hypothetical protein